MTPVQAFSIPAIPGGTERVAQTHAPVVLRPPRCMGCVGQQLEVSRWASYRVSCCANAAKLADQGPVAEIQHRLARSLRSVKVDHCAGVPLRPHIVVRWLSDAQHRRRHAGCISSAPQKESMPLSIHRGGVRRSRSHARYGLAEYMHGILEEHRGRSDIACSRNAIRNRSGNQSRACKREPSRLPARRPVSIPSSEIFSRSGGAEAAAS